LKAVLPGFQTIDIHEVSFEYTDSEGIGQFKVGPINLNFSAGEIIFIVGGNGSGKSTFLKLLTGLYYPLRGAITIDGEALDSDLYPDYRELFSIIFTDFHLFDRLYGVEGVDERSVRSLLKELGMGEKTSFRDGAFTNTHLSTGQKAPRVCQCDHGQ
jgi:putative ATP-binding cassette transporter